MPAYEETQIPCLTAKPIFSDPALAGGGGRHQIIFLQGLHRPHPHHWSICALVNPSRPCRQHIGRHCTEHNAYRDMPRDMENMTVASASRLPYRSRLGGGSAGLPTEAGGLQQHQQRLDVGGAATQLGHQSI
jgi:hypothetical protein